MSLFIINDLLYLIMIASYFLNSHFDILNIYISNIYVMVSIIRNGCSSSFELTNGLTQ